MERKTSSGRLTGFVAILYYEFLWNLRKKKTIGLFIIVFAIVTLQLALPPILSSVQGRPFPQDPTFVITSVGTLSGFFIFLLAVATTMNTISGEFESGSITPLLTKPVSRNLVFVGKVFAAFLSLLAVYTFLALYMTLGGLAILGHQNNLELVPLGILGLTLATMVWTSIVLALGTLSKNSIVAALGSFGFFLGLLIVGVVFLGILGSTAILFFAPGDGAPGSFGSCEFGGGFGGGGLSTGTNAVGLLLMEWLRDPGLTLNFCGFRFTGGMQEVFLASSDSIGTVASRAVGVSLAYVGVLLFVSWLAFRRSEIVE